MVPEGQADDIREVIFQKYRIIYRIHQAEVQILTVVHGSRLLDIGSLTEPSNG